MLYLALAHLMFRKSQGALFVTCLLAAGMGYYYGGIFLPRARALLAAHSVGGGYAFGADFYPIWLTARECLRQRRDPYSPETTGEIQVGLFGHELNGSTPGNPAAEYRAFFYPASVALFGSLLAWLPFATARIVLAALLLPVLAISVLLWSKAVGWKGSPPALAIFIFLTFSSYPAMEGLYAEQAGLIVGFLLAATMVALMENHQRIAGCLLALAAMKPQASLLVIAYLLLWALSKWAERRKFALALLLTMALLLLGPMLVWPAWIAGWFHVLLQYHKYSRPPLLPDLFGSYFGAGLTVFVLAAALKLAWSRRRESPASLQFGFTISVLLAVTTITLLPEHAVYDHIILLPGIMLVIRYWRELWQRSAAARGTLALSAAAFFWPWLAALVLVVFRVFGSHLVDAAPFLPLRTAAALPFIVLALLYVISTQKEGRTVVVPEWPRAESRPTFPG